MEMINDGFFMVDDNTAIHLERIDYIRCTNGHLDFHMSSGKVVGTSYTSIEEFFDALNKERKRVYDKAIEKYKEQYTKSDSFYVKSPDSDKAV